MTKMKEINENRGKKDENEGNIVEMANIMDNFWKSKAYGR